jgi:hypothetical protein
MRGVALTLNGRQKNRMHSPYDDLATGRVEANVDHGSAESDRFDDNPDQGSTGNDS